MPYNTNNPITKISMAEALQRYGGLVKNELGSGLSQIWLYVSEDSFEMITGTLGYFPQQLVPDMKPEDIIITRQVPEEIIKVLKVAAIAPSGGLIVPKSNTASISGPPLFDILPTSDLSLWTSDKLPANLIIEVDKTVLFNGKPSIKITIPAGVSGTCRVGCTTALASLPYLWDRENMVMPVRYSGFTGYNMTSTFPPTLVGYIGDAAYANFWTINGFGGGNFPEMKPRQDEWSVMKPLASQWVTGAGTPLTILGNGTSITSQRCRSKLQWTQVSQATDCFIWVGAFAVMPKRKKPTIILTWDDGYASWHSFIAPLCKHYKLPISMGIDSGLVDGSNYLTSTQVRDLYSDPSNLFDIVNHGVNNQSYNTIGAKAYFQTLETTRKYLNDLGILGDGPLHHPLVQSVWGNDLVDLMSGAGYLSARAAQNIAMHQEDQVIQSDKLRWILNIIAALGSATTLAQANAAIDTVVTNNGFGMINAHDFANTASAFVWTYGDTEQLLGRIAALRDAGTIEVKSWSRWYADLTGRTTDRL